MAQRYGTEGTPTLVQTNAFQLEWHPRSKVFHYDAIIPLFTARSGKDIKLSGAKGFEIMQRLQTQMAPAYFSTRKSAFDGKKNLYVFEVLPFTNGASERFEVPLDNHSRNPKLVQVTITYAREVNVSVLRNYLAGHFQGQPGAVNSDALVSLSMLQVFLQAAPRMAHGALFKGSSVYPKPTRPISMGPFELRPGFFQSIRPTMKRLILNVDPVLAPTLERQPLADVCLNYISPDLRDNRVLQDLERTKFDNLKQFLRGIKVVIKLGNHASSMKARAIRGLVQDVGAESFEQDGVSTTVADYFMRAYNVSIPKRTLGVLIGHHELFPIFVCEVPSQIYSSRLPPEFVNTILKNVPRNPDERLSRIQSGLKLLSHENSEFLRADRISIDPKPLAINGRFLAPPDIAFGRPHPQQHRVQVSLVQRRGAWDTMGKRLYYPSEGYTLAVINLTGRITITSSLMHRFVFELANLMREKGIHINNTQPPVIQDSGPQSDILATMNRAIRDAQNAPGLYENAKRAGDILLGVPTQCVRWSGKLQDDVGHQKANQYMNNLILKMNGKMRGTNYVPLSAGMEYLKEKITIVLGLGELQHPCFLSPKAHTISGCITSIPWKHGSILRFGHNLYRWLLFAQIRAQPSRMEIIEKLTEMVLNAVQDFSKTNPLLQRIIIFRDGVSEGEFEQVRMYELEPLKAALAQAYTRLKVTAIPRPAFTFIVVGKRHHFRFFPKRPQDQDRSGNMLSGFVIDQGIEHPVYPDFYLQSQPGLKGTSIPGHYSIIEDENYGGDANKWVFLCAHRFFTEEELVGYKQYLTHSATAMRAQRAVSKFRRQSIMPMYVFQEIIILDFQSD
ncbi:Piwi domain-containing protein [Rhodocollybia butyracea]|uniref:Piwi domain-containing protein n=1 Tax=Rhodocollybia butyracea TaxID=206335 RepID=A0A9P5UBD0_9AGAR|nr:Piwi domain-containing protein [Rhodocollybia butyracea]